MIKGKLNPKPDLSGLARPKRKSRKEKPPKTMIVEMPYPSAPPYLIVALGFCILLLTIMICVWKFLE